MVIKLLKLFLMVLVFVEVDVRVFLKLFHHNVLLFLGKVLNVFRVFV